MSKLTDRELAALEPRVLAMWDESGITDPVERPKALVRDETVEFSVETASRGRVVFATVPLLDVANLFADTAGEYVAELETELDRIVNARTRKRQETSAEKTAEAIRRYEKGDLVKNIAKDLERGERWVYGVVPEKMKKRRKIT